MPFKHLTIEPKTLRICSYKEFEPIMYGEGKGFEADVLCAIAKLWGLNIKFYPQKKYENIWDSPEKDNFDIAAGGISPRKDRKEHALFSIPTAHYSQSLLVRKIDYINGRIEDYSSFKNNQLTIGIVKGSDGEKYGAIQARDCGLKSDVFVYYESESELLPALLKKEISAIARGEIGNDYQAAKNPELCTIALKDFGETFCFAVDPERKEFLKELNNAIQKVTQSGKISYKEWSLNNKIFSHCGASIS